MAYVALLRGINVGGKALVDMKKLKETCEALGLANVRTYINSGNVVFTGGGKDRSRLRRRIEGAIRDDFGLDVVVLLRDTGELRAVVDALPKQWRNDSVHKCDVYFSDDFTGPKSIELLPLTPGIEETRFAPGAILCRMPRAKQSKSKLTRLIGTDLYKRMTVRNCNTARKLYELATAADGA
jgi:uncharacterized protein (DUF1697 family)